MAEMLLDDIERALEALTERPAGDDGPLPAMADCAFVHARDASNSLTNRPTTDMLP